MFARLLIGPALTSQAMAICLLVSPALAGDLVQPITSAGPEVCQASSTPTTGSQMGGPGSSAPAQRRMAPGMSQPDTMSGRYYPAGSGMSITDCLNVAAREGKPLSSCKQ